MAENHEVKQTRRKGNSNLSSDSKENSDEESQSESLASDGAAGKLEDEIVEEVGEANENEVKVYSVLEPARLMIIPVEVENVKAMALVDSGATSSLIAEDLLEKFKTEKMDSETIVIKGLGESTVMTSGSIKLQIAIYNKILHSCRFRIVKRKTIDVPIILGVDFLKQNKMQIDMSKNRIAIKDSSGALTKFYIDDQGALLKVVEEQIPVFAAESVKLKDDFVKLPIVMNITCAMGDNDSNYYYKSEIKNRKIEGLEGILDGRDKQIMVRRLDSEAKNDINIKKGDKVGTVSTLIEIDEDCENIDAEWSIEKIKDNKGIGEQLTLEMKNQVCEMLLKTQKALSKGETDIGMAQVTPHKIELTNSTPIWQRPRRFAEPVTKEKENNVRT